MRFAFKLQLKVQKKIKLYYFKKIARVAIFSLIPMCLASCAGWLPASGPSMDALIPAPLSSKTMIRVVDLDSVVTSRLALREKRYSFSEQFVEKRTRSFLINPGDFLEISIWEASPAMLFSVTPSSASFPLGSASRANTLPEQMVSLDGYISVPFGGRVKVVGKTLEQVETDIASSLKGKANHPQVIARMTRNESSYVTVVGEVQKSVLMPITPRGERLLDAIAAAGGVKQAVSKTTLKLSRGAVSSSISMEKAIQNPEENIALQKGDVVTVYYQPLSFTALGATGKNDEINFEANGISLIQALARVSGLSDSRASTSGVYIFRFEDSHESIIDRKQVGVEDTTKQPVVYRIDMSEPTSFFIAQNFQIRNKDVLYVANASSVELQKFLNILISVIYPIVNIGIIAN